MKSFWKYTLARFAVLLAVYALVALAFFGWPGFFVFSTMTNLLALGIAAIIGSLISMFLLAGLREELASHIEAKAHQMNDRIERSRSAEDVD